MSNVYRDHEIRAVEGRHGHVSYTIHDPDGRPVVWSLETKSAARNKIDRIIDRVDRGTRPPNMRGAR